MKISQAEKLKLALETMLDTKGVVGFKIARNLRMINDELQEYYQFKQELFKKYGELKDGFYSIEKGTPAFDEFMKEFTPLAEQEINFDFRMLKEDELVDSGLSAGQMAQIWEIVE